jgi:hypothetical protein
VINISSLAKGSSALRIRGAEEREQGQEQVDDVEVERDGGPHVLVVGVALDEVVGVVDDVPAEDERGEPAVDHERDAAQREEELDHGEDDEDHDGGEEEGPEEAEVVAAPRRPERVRRQAQHHRRGQDRRLQDDRALREGAGQAHGEADGHGEEAEEEEVHGVAHVVVVQRAQHCNNNNSIGSVSQSNERLLASKKWEDTIREAKRAHVRMNGRMRMKM